MASCLSHARCKSGDNPDAEGGKPLTNENKTDLNKSWLDAKGDSISSTPAFDPDEYREYVEELDLTEEQENELLGIIWSIMAAFVDLGFGVDSIQFLPDEVKSSFNEKESEKHSLKGPDEAMPQGLETLEEIVHDE